MVSTDFWPMQVNPIAGGEIAAALLEAGIENAVIVVSACRFGLFIPYLDRPYLVMTAAAADRNPFGCSRRKRETAEG